MSSVEISDWGVKRGGESVAWDALTKVEIMTTDEGPMQEDVFWLLHGADGKGVAVPGGAAQECGLLGVLQQRLPGLDNEAVIAASGSVENARFLIWSR